MCRGPPSVPALTASAMSFWSSASSGAASSSRRRWIGEPSGPTSTYSAATFNGDIERFTPAVRHDLIGSAVSSASYAATMHHNRHLFTSTTHRGKRPSETTAQSGTGTPSRRSARSLAYTRLRKNRVAVLDLGEPDVGADSSSFLKKSSRVLHVQFQVFVSMNEVHGRRVLPNLVHWAK